MSIKFVVLGYISWQPMSGYDLKRIIADSETLHWTANNNQIYTALVRLHDDGWVSKTIEKQEGAPDRHIYTITGKGAQALNEWVRTAPQAPSMAKPFLYQLMWADVLEVDELDALLEAYLNSVGEKQFFLKVEADKKKNMPERSPREKYIWDMIHTNWIGQYEGELNWIRQMRRDLSQKYQ